MKMKKSKLFFITFYTTSLSLVSCNGISTTSNNNNTIEKDSFQIKTKNASLNNFKPVSIKKLEIPKTTTNDVIITHTGYTLSYNESYEQANWVAYELTREETNKIVERSNKFMIDPKVKTGTANDKDYAGSGYDKGHLAPAADMGWSSITMEESFYYSNMSPQEPGFNRGIWKKLEEQVRSWAIEDSLIYIVTGPVLTGGLSTIGFNQVAVPKYFYKVILDYTEPSIKGIGFIISNSASKIPLQNYAVTIDSVEKFTGIDFYPLLPDDQEESIESTIYLNCWSWKIVKMKNGSTESKKSSITKQCLGKTKSGNRCKRMTTSPNGYCFQHGGN